MRNSKFLLTSLLAAATMSATAFGADATWSGTAENTDWSGANWTKDSSGQTIDSADKAVFTSDTAGRTVTATGEVSADKLSVGIGGNITFSGGTFKFTNTTDGIPAGEDTTTASQNWGTVKIASGATLDFAGNFAAARWSLSNQGAKTVEVLENAVLSVSGTMSADTGLALTNNGIIKVGNLQYKTGNGWNTNTFTGTGTIIAGTLTIGNIAQLKIENQKLILGSGGITTGGWGFALGAMTLGAFENWSSSRDITFNAASGKKTIIDTSAYDTTNYTTSATDGKTITLSGTLSVSGAVEKIGAGTLELAGTVNVGEGGSITVSAGTLTSRGTFNLTSAGTLNGTISATGGTLNLAGKLNLTSAIDVTDGVSVTVSNSVAFVLSDAVKSGSEWILISGASSIDSWNTDTLSIGNFRKEDGTYFTGRGGSISIGGVGKVSVTEGQSANLVWSGEQDSNWDTTTRNWTNEGQADSFYFVDNVTFDKDAAVTVDAAGVAAGKVTIASGKAVTLSDGNVTAYSGFELQSGATLSLGAGSANGATATLADDSHYIVTATTGAFDFSNVSGTGSLVFRPTVANPGYNGGIKVALSDDFTGEFVLDTNVWLSFAADHSTFGGATIVLSGGALFHSTKTVNLTNDIRLDSTAAIWSDNSNATVTLSGDVTGSSGTLNRRGGGAMIFSKSLSVGTFNQETGATRVTGTATLGTASVSGGSLTFEGATNITSATVTGGTLNFKISTLNNAQSFTSATDISVSGGTVWFGQDVETLSSDSFGENIALTVSGLGTAKFAISQGNNKIFSGALKLENGGTYFKHDGGVELAGNVTLGEADSDVVYLLGDWGKLGTNISGALSGAGTAYFGNDRNMDNSFTVEKLTISGSDNSYSGEIVVGKKKTDTPSANNTELVLSTETALQYGKVNLAGSAAGNYAQLTLGSNAVTIAGLSGTEFGKVALGSGVSSSTLTLNQASDTTFSGTIADGIALKKAGAGTLILNGDNSAYTGTVTLEAGTLGVGHANALGTSTVNVTGDAKLALGDRISITSLGITNNISIADSVKLTLGGGYAVELNGAITGSGTLRADMPWLTVALGGDNSGFSGAVEVVGTTVDAAHASALGTGILKISSADPLVGTERTSGTVQASAANVALHDVSIELVRTDSPILRSKTPSDSFTVAEGATLYLDIGLLTEATLTGEQVALTIAAASAFDNSFFSAVEVGTYVDDAWQISSEWKYLADSWDVGTGTLTITAIPEPSMFGLLAGLGALALAGTRRRRKKA